MFIENVGQFPAPASVATADGPRFMTRDSSMTSYLSPDAIWITLGQTITSTMPAAGTQSSQSEAQPLATPVPETPDLRGRVNLHLIYWC